MREGASIGPYRVVRKLGEGGMGTVYLGEHTLIGRHAAIKVLLPELSSRRESVDRFFNEARATTAITDPGIVQVFDFGVTTDQVAYIVMELLEGEQLSVRLDRLGALSPGDALRITRQAAGSLGAAHAAGIVHRDLKPENLFMIRDPEAPGGERPKILDFGIAKLGDDVPDRIRTRTGAVLGTPVYMSPEQCDGAGRVDHRADIYALGCVLFQLLTGRPPFDLPGLGAVISAHLREPAPPPTSIAPHLPPQVDEVVLRCLAKSPDARFATMLELQQACDAVLALITAPGGSRSMPIAASWPPSPGASPTAGSSVMRAPRDAARTTLGTSVGEPIAAAGRSRRRLGLWVAVAAIVGGTGAAIAVRSGARGTSRPAARAIDPAVRDPGAHRDEPAVRDPGAQRDETPARDPGVQRDEASAPVVRPTPVEPLPTPSAASAAGDAGDPVAANAAPANAAPASATPANAAPANAAPANAAPASATPANATPANATPAPHKPAMVRPAVKRPARSTPVPPSSDLYDDRN